MRMILPLLGLAVGAFAQMRFRAQEIQRDFGVVYAVLAVDMNQDRKPDIVAINPAQAVWYENPTWEKRVVMDGATKKDNVCVAAHDVDGDGHVDLALGADWQPTNTSGGGTLQWVGREAGHPAGLWNLTPLGEEPTLVQPPRLP